jgi:hypothetical protein
MDKDSAKRRAKRWRYGEKHATSVEKAKRCKEKAEYFESLSS